MTTDHLPDDLSEWPRDPYRLLGVNRRTAARDARRAYTGLIRRFKPEQFPEHFRQIREAYERISSLNLSTSPGALFRDDVDVRPQPPTESEGRPLDAHCDGPDAGPSKAPVSKAPSYRASVATEHWRKAVAGDRSTAYAALVDLQMKSPSQPKYYLMLYWLLAIDTTLDKKRNALDWLAQGLMLAGYKDPLRELYRREMRFNPRAALTARHSAVAKVHVNHPLLHELFEFRWIAATGRKDACQIIVSDIESLRRQSHVCAPQRWSRILLEALRHLMWLRLDPESDRACSKYQSELTAFDFLQRDMAGEMDWLDHGFVISKECLQLKRGDPTIQCVIELIESYWRLPVDHWRPRLMSQLNSWVVDPRSGLRAYDTVREQSRIISGQFLQIVRSAAGNDRVLSNSDYPQIELTVMAFFNSLSTTRFSHVRPRLLEFCLREAISPDLFAHVLLRQQPTLGPSVVKLTDALKANMPLNTIYHAHRLFWE